MYKIIKEVADMKRKPAKNPQKITIKLMMIIHMIKRSVKYSIESYSTLFNHICT